MPFILITICVIAAFVLLYTIVRIAELLTLTPDKFRQAETEAGKHSKTRNLK